MTQLRNQTEVIPFRYKIFENARKNSKSEKKNLHI